MIDILLYSHHLPAWYCIVIVRRNSVLVTCGSERVKHPGFLPTRWPDRGTSLGRISPNKNTPIHPCTGIRIIQIVLFTFPLVQTRRICLKISSFLKWWSFQLFSWQLYLINGWYCKDKLKTSYSKGWKGQKTTLMTLGVRISIRSMLRIVSGLNESLIKAQRYKTSLRSWVALAHFVGLTAN